MYLVGNWIVDVDSALRVPATLTKRYIYCPGYDDYKHVQEDALGPLLHGDDGEGDGLDERLVLVP